MGMFRWLIFQSSFQLQINTVGLTLTIGIAHYHLLSLSMRNSHSLIIIFYISWEHTVPQSGCCVVTADGYGSCHVLSHQMQIGQFFDEKNQKWNDQDLFPIILLTTAFFMLLFPSPKERDGSDLLLTKFSLFWGLRVVQNLSGIFPSSSASFFFFYLTDFTARTYFPVFLLSNYATSFVLLLCRCVLLKDLGLTMLQNVSALLLDMPFWCAYFWVQGK